MKYLAKNLKFLREQKGLTQAAIEAVLGIRRTTWNNYENNVSVPSLGDFVRIANYLGIQEQYILHVNLSRVGDLNALIEHGKKRAKGDLINDPNSDLFAQNHKISALNEEAAEYKKQVSQDERLIAALMGENNALKQLTERLQADLKKCQEGKK